MEQGGRKGKAALPPSSLAPKKCPRCDSTNTKFCYFNNYSSSQPRHFCKACRRYWTEGGTLRNVPQGGASTRHRRNKRPRKSSSSVSFSSSSASTSNDHHHHHHHHHNSRLLLANSSPAEVGVDPLLMPPPPPPFFYGGGLGLPPFHPGSGIGGDLTGFPAAVAEEMAPPPPPQGNPLLLPGFGFPLVEQQLLAPFDGAGLVAHQPRAPPAFSQQMINATVFSTTTAGPATTAAAAGSDRGEPFWVTGFGGGSGQGSSRWGPHNSFDQGSGPRPPPSSFI